jgi:hypothetical protein
MRCDFALRKNLMHYHKVSALDIGFIDRLLRRDVEEHHE